MVMTIQSNILFYNSGYSTFISFCTSATFLIFDVQNPTSINHDAAQSANTNQEMNTPEMTDIIYATVHFASSR